MTLVRKMEQWKEIVEQPKPILGCRAVTEEEEIHCTRYRETY
jgi:hypothetical protein